MSLPLGELGVALRNKDENRVLELCRPIAWAAIHELYLPVGMGDREDLLQEARHGIVEAVRCFRGQTRAFPNFALLCARRKALTAVKGALRGKHRVASQATSLDRHRTSGRGHEDSMNLADTVSAGRHLEVSTIAEGREAYAELHRAIMTSLSPLERKALIHVRINGGSYKTYDSDDVEGKRLDNALQRALRKLETVRQHAA